MALHELKTWPGPFRSIAAGEKRHEIRTADRPFAVGDVLQLREFNPATSRYSGRVVYVHVTYLTPGGEWGLPDDLCVMSISLDGPGLEAELATARAAATVLRGERDQARLELADAAKHAELLAAEIRVCNTERNEARRELEHALKEQARLRDGVNALLAELEEANEELGRLEELVSTHPTVLAQLDLDLAALEASDPNIAAAAAKVESMASQLAREMREGTAVFVSAPTCSTCNEPVGPHQGCRCDGAPR